MPLSCAQRWLGCYSLVCVLHHNFPKKGKVRRCRGRFCPQGGCHEASSAPSFSALGGSLVPLLWAVSGVLRTSRQCHSTLKSNRKGVCSAECLYQSPFCNNCIIDRLLRGSASHLRNCSGFVHLKGRNYFGNTSVKKKRFHCFHIRILPTTPTK